MTIEGDEALGFEKVAVSFGAPLGEFRNEVDAGIFGRFPEAVMHGGPRHAGLEAFEMIDGAVGVGVFPGDRFALLGHAEISGERAMRKGAHEPVCGTGPTGNRAAPTMKVSKLDAVLFADGGDRFLRVVECPLTREDATVFVRVAVAEHDLLAWRAAPSGKGEAGFDGRVGKVVIDDPGSVREVAESFKERDDLKGTDGLVCVGFGEAGFACEEVHEKEVGELAGHTHDERSGAGSARATVIDEDAVAFANGIGFGTGGLVDVKKGPWRLQLGGEEGNPIGFAPVGKGAAVFDPGGFEELGGGFIVEGAVLTDVEFGHVKPEGFEFPLQGANESSRKSSRADGEERCMKELEVSGETLRCDVEVGSELGAEEVAEGAPGLVGIPVTDVGTFGPEGGDEFVNPFRECCRSRMRGGGNGKLLGDGAQLAAVEFHRLAAEFGEGVAGHLGGDEGVSIAIAPDPEAKADFRSAAGIFECGRVEAGLFPGLL